MEIRENVTLALYTTFRIGGPARYFCEVESVDDLKSALKCSKENNLRFFILGGGSNILVSDKGFDGMVIKMGIKGLEFRDEGGCVIVSVGAGENWDGVVAKVVERDLGGIENLSLIPGTAGAAVCQNIGAYGVEIKDVLKNAEVLDANSGEIKTLTNDDCHFGYRNSVFKSNGNLIVFKANLRLLKNSKPNIQYPDLVRLFENKNPTIAKLRQAVIDIRKSKLSYPDEIGNAGSFFKNPVIRKKYYEKLVLKHGDLKGFNSKDDTVKLSAGQLIEKCGWKGKTHGGVGVSPKHSLVLVNYGNGTAGEIIGLANNLKVSVKIKFGVELEPEVEVICGA